MAVNDPPSLCCTLNPKGQCRQCGAKICSDCATKFRDRDSSRPNCPVCKWKSVVYGYPLRFREPNTVYKLVRTFPAPSLSGFGLYYADYGYEYWQ